LPDRRRRAAWAKPKRDGLRVQRNPLGDNISSYERRLR
jgi:hypothetical protein